MANKTCRPLTEEELEKVILALKSGYVHNGTRHRSNTRVAFCIWLEANLGLRCGDIVNLSLRNFIKKNNDTYIILEEKKTKKRRELYVPNEIFEIIMDYCIENGISKNEKLIDLSVRNIQKQLSNVCEYLELGEAVSTHSARKRFATQAYLSSNYNLILLQSLLLHSSPDITRRYIGISDSEQKRVLDATITKF